MGIVGTTETSTSVELKAPRGVEVAVRKIWLEAEELAVADVQTSGFRKGFAGLRVVRKLIAGLCRQGCHDKQQEAAGVPQDLVW